MLNWYWRFKTCYTNDEIKSLKQEVKDKLTVNVRDIKEPAMININEAVSK